MYAEGELPLIREVRRGSDPVSMKANKAGSKVALPPISSMTGFTETRGTLLKQRSPPVTSRGDLSQVEVSSASARSHRSSPFAASSLIGKTILRSINGRTTDGMTKNVKGIPSADKNKRLSLPLVSSLAKTSGQSLISTIFEEIPNIKMKSCTGRNWDNRKINASHLSKTETVLQSTSPPFLRPCLSLPQSNTQEIILQRTNGSRIPSPKTYQGVHSSGAQESRMNISTPPKYFPAQHVQQSDHLIAPASPKINSPNRRNQSVISDEVYTEPEQRSSASMINPEQERSGNDGPISVAAQRSATGSKPEFEQYRSEAQSGLTFVHIGVGTKRLLEALAMTQPEINGTSRPVAAASTSTTDLSELDKSIDTQGQPPTIPIAMQDSVPEKNEGWNPADETMHATPHCQTETVLHSKTPTPRSYGINSLRDQQVKINIATQKTPAIAPSSQESNFLIQPPFQESRSVSSNRPVLSLKENKVCTWPGQITTDAEKKLEKENGTPNTAASLVLAASFKPRSEQPQGQMQSNRETVNIVTGSSHSLPKRDSHLNSLLTHEPIPLCYLGSDSAELLAWLRATYTAIDEARSLASTLAPNRAYDVYKKIATHWISFMNMWATGKVSDSFNSIPNVQMPPLLSHMYRIATEFDGQKLGQKRTAIMRDTSKFVGQWVMTSIAATPMTGMMA